MEWDGHTEPVAPPPTSSMSKLGAQSSNDVEVTDSLFCTECGDQRAEVSCTECEDDYCEVCWHFLHKKGNRRNHTFTKLISAVLSASSLAALKVQKEVIPSSLSSSSSPASSVAAVIPPSTIDHTVTDMHHKTSSMTDNSSASKTDAEIDAIFTPLEGMDVYDDDSDTNGDDSAMDTDKDIWNDKDFENTTDGADKDNIVKVDDGYFKKMMKRCKYIPVRLTEEERRLLTLLESCLNVSEYTDHIDIISSNKGERIVNELREIFRVITGLALTSDYDDGKERLSRNLGENAVFFQRIFEIGRRYKICNPDKMRTTYVKMLHMLQDAQQEDIKGLPNMVIEIQTVYTRLKSCNKLEMLQDKDVSIATDIINGKGMSLQQVQDMKDRRNKAFERVANRYACAELSQDDIKLLLSSIGDNNSYLKDNRDPVERMIYYLKKYFDPSDASASLQISAGRNGSKLSHSHSTQYTFVLQSLTLWKEILNEMFMLWYLTEQDFLDERNTYRLRNTGQGLHRMQSAPRISSEMQNIVGRVKKRVGSWQGLSVVHLGDQDVPNALVFIDKYNQVSRILNPIVSCIESLVRLSQDKNIDEHIFDYISPKYGVDGVRLMILTDFFRHGFDGSGSDGGSCIDGRLTSSWNWCSKLNKKLYYNIFLLSGFTSFDGDW